MCASGKATKLDSERNRMCMPWSYNFPSDDNSGQVGIWMMLYNDQNVRFKKDYI